MMTFICVAAQHIADGDPGDPCRSPLALAFNGRLRRGFYAVAFSDHVCVKRRRWFFDSVEVARVGLRPAFANHRLRTHPFWMIVELPASVRRDVPDSYFLEVST